MPKFSITTRRGDAGDTRLFSGETVRKNAPRPSAYGDLDELISVLGVARAQCRHAATQEAVLRLQRQLFVAGSELATTPGGFARLKQRVDAAMLAELDERCAALEARLTMPRGFIVPGASLAGAQLDVARTVSRRVERQVVGLADAGEVKNAELLAWLNRLSDYLWLLARSEEDAPTML